ncbi:MAG: hypothetical protein RBG13Loki_3808 [Promethearchaeota archaeon CR_4]|nr:MAG: hypothetical protein RBG13Loki_3808 [Candidatus Lokiarchaeota archaeon CR_4]
MYYSFEHESRVEQGDICYNIPKIIPSSLISTEETQPTWKNYIENIKKKTS